MRVLMSGVLMQPEGYFKKTPRHFWVSNESLNMNYCTMEQYQQSIGTKYPLNNDFYDLRDF
jgi:hypothetical protein